MFIMFLPTHFVVILFYVQVLKFNLTNRSSRNEVNSCHKKLSVERLLHGSVECYCDTREDVNTSGFHFLATSR